MIRRRSLLGAALALPLLAGMVGCDKDQLIDDFTIAPAREAVAPQVPIPPGNPIQDLTARPHDPGECPKLPSARGWRLSCEWPHLTNR